LLRKKQRACHHRSHAQRLDNRGDVRLAREMWKFLPMKILPPSKFFPAEPPHGNATPLTSPRPRAYRCMIIIM
jgi:hypothetical protein